MSNSGITPELAELAMRLVEELASEIDLNYGDDEIRDAGPAFAAMERLQSMTDMPPGATQAHVADRYLRSLEKKG